MDSPGFLCIFSCYAATGSDEIRCVPQNIFVISVMQYMLNLLYANQLPVPIKAHCRAGIVDASVAGYVATPIQLAIGGAI